jgi:hypothetical protein
MNNSTPLTPSIWSGWSSWASASCAIYIRASEINITRDNASNLESPWVVIYPQRQVKNGAWALISAIGMKCSYERTTQTRCLCICSTLWQLLPLAYLLEERGERRSISLVSFFGSWVEVSPGLSCPRLCTLFGPGNSLNGMAHTVQRSSASGKRKAPPSSSDPPTPSPKKKGKVATARKSTGGRTPAKRNSGIEPEGCEHVSVLWYYVNGRYIGVAAPKKRRFRPGTVALREIRKYQKSTELLIQKLPFSRVVSLNLLITYFIRLIFNRFEKLHPKWQQIPTLRIAQIFDGKAQHFLPYRKLRRRTSFISLKTRKVKTTFYAFIHWPPFFRNLCAIHAKRVTIMTRDIQLARRIRGPWGGLA